MKAKEMFEELGYMLMTQEMQELTWGDYSYYDEKEIYYSQNPQDWDFDGICFSLNEKTFYAEIRYNYPIRIDLKLYKAITQKMKELGWL